MKLLELKKLAILGIFGAASFLAATPGYAVNGSFSKTKNPGYIVVAGLPGTARFGTLSSDFPAGTLNMTKTITSVSYAATTYTNGAINQQVIICMTRQYSTVNDVCLDISNARSGTLSVFNGKTIAAGVDFSIQHRLTGGTYPTATPATPDQITVNYSY
ncbi:MAG: hypothetical protein K2P67_00995 [Gallionellaceae bacterium]|jgi:hypothetical protein|nr:hypothetical protein [Gallionellaceae bacterium]